MIKPGEIQKKANETKVRDTQIEKDYILSWILWGISQQEELSKTIVFKGGTVLKKVYFEDYRFSEDLDFTLLDDNITNQQIFDWFKESFAFVKEEANITLDIIEDNEHDDGGINFYISYVGPLGGAGANKKVKVDISRSEKIQFDPEIMPVHICYTDLEEYSLLCYPLSEIMVEKLRSTMQRLQPRDYYDIWYLIEHEGMDPSDFQYEFEQKCRDKEIDASKFHEKLADRIPQYKARWKTSMGEQIHNLPAFDDVQRETARGIKKLKF